MTDTDTDEGLCAEEVDLAYGAKFGPDVGDIHDWQERAIKLVEDRVGEERAEGQA